MSGFLRFFDAPVNLITYSLFRGISIGRSLDTIHEQTGLAKNTIIRIRRGYRICLERHYDARILGGPDKVVEIDESKFKRRANMGRLPARQGWVFGMTERGVNGR